ncbi:hypothetical protein A2U01_0036879, partial [Trifolium medium]|nr:hypothetical protein [Trifolium medium]
MHHKLVTDASDSKPKFSDIYLIHLAEIPGWPLFSPAKDSKKNRDLLGAYWDKLSIEEAREAVSFENVTLE